MPFIFLHFTVFCSVTCESWLESRVEVDADFVVETVFPVIMVDIIFVRAPDQGAL